MTIRSISAAVGGTKDVNFVPEYRWVFQDCMEQTEKQSLHIAEKYAIVRPSTKVKDFK
jgi:hypothetical protein